LKSNSHCKNEIRILPILVEGAQMPRSEHLPESLHSFSRRNALPISLTADFDHHMNERLIPELDQALREA
jgi:hypothetical protein